MFPTLTHSRSASKTQSPTIQNRKGSFSNPLQLTADHSPLKSPAPSPLNAQGHIGHHIPEKTVELQSGKDVDAKRIQLGQLQFKTDDTHIPNTTQFLKEKVDDVFNAFSLAINQNLIDNRNSTVPIFTLPEFFWSDFDSTLTVNQHETLIQDIQARAQGDEFEGSLFVLGTLVSSKPPPSLASLHPQDIQKIQQQLGGLSQLNNEAPIDFHATYAQAMDQTLENCATDQQEARALLATVGDMLESLLNKADIKADTPLAQFGNLEFNRDAQMDRVLDRVKIMATHREALALIATTKNLPDNETMTAIIDSVKRGDTDGAALLLAPSLQPGFKPKDLNATLVSSLSKLFEATKADQETLTSVTRSFRKFYFPKSATNQDRTLFNRRVKKMKSGIRRLNNPSSMYKLTENKAMVIEGGKDGKFAFTQKLLPSHADSPSYFANRDSALLVPQKLQSASTIANPAQKSSDLGRKIQDHQIDPSNFVFNSPKTGIDLGVAICRDYSDGVYKDHFDSGIRDTIDHLQVVAAGVPTIDARKGSAKTSVGLNDGQSGNSQFVTSENLPHLGGDDYRTDIIEYNPNSQDFTFYQKGLGFVKKPMQLEDKSFAMGISRPTHLADRALSTAGSFKSDTNAGTINIMKTLIQEHTDSIASWKAKIAVLEPMLSEVAANLQQIEEIENSLAHDRGQKELYERQHGDHSYQMPLDHEQRRSKLTQLQEEITPWLDQVNSDPSLLAENGDKPYEKTQGVAAYTMLKKQIATLNNQISRSTKIIDYNNEHLNHITIDRLRNAQQRA